MQHLGNVLRGFLMGSADIVPGVSGGTVALVLGIYERLVHNIRTGARALGELARGRPGGALTRLREVEWAFLLPLLAGIFIALLSLARLLETLLEDYPQETAAVFFGLIAGSITIAWRLVTGWTGDKLAVLAVVAGVAFAVLGLRSGEIDSPSALLFFGAGAIAIVAMILPGISGSFILLMIGMYEAVLAAVNDREIASLAVVALGAVLGLAAFSSLLDRMLRDHHDTVMAGLIGLMIGSLRVLWPWPDGTDSARLAAPEGADWVGALLLALVAFAAVQVIAYAGAVRQPEPAVTETR